MSNKIIPIAVVGAGAAGSMAALRAGLNNDEIHLFPGNAKHKKKSRAQWVTKIENVPGLSKYRRGISDPHKESLEEFMESPLGHKLHVHKNVGISKIEKLDDGLFRLEGTNDETFLAQFVIIATGVMDVQPEIEGSIKTIFPYANIQLIDYCIRCDGHRSYGKETGVIGHGPGAAWVAIMLKERYELPNAVVLTNGLEPEWDENTQDILDMYNIDVVKEPIVDFLGNPKEGILEGATLENGHSVYFDFAFVSLGMLVYNKLATDVGADVDERGFVITNDKGESTVSNLYVAGDLRANTKKQIYTAWDTAVDSADDINGKIRKERRNKLLEQHKNRRFSHV